MLTLLWLLPALAGLAIAAGARRRPRAPAAAAALATLAIALGLAAGFDPARHGYQFEQRASWIPQFGVEYHLGLDGLSLWLVVLNCLLTVVAVFATGRTIARPAGFLGLLLLLEAAMNGLFLAADLLVFYVFWEAMLIPAYFLLWLWGEGPRPLRAALKFVLYTLVGSLLMLVAVIGEYVYAGGGTHGFDLARLAAHPPSTAIQFGLFGLFGLAFAIKVPAFPFHGWLPDAYNAAPTALLVTFAGVMGKTGAYAMLRVLVPLLPHPQLWWDWNGVMPVLAVLGIAWGGLMALTQRDAKLVIAYSSISHMGFIVLGIFAFNQQGQQGAVLQMVNHGLIVPALFLLVGWITGRAGGRDRGGLHDLAARMPVMAGMFLIVSLAALGLPGLNSFVGELMTLLGAWQLSPGLAVAACAGLVLAPVYMLRLFQGMMYAGPPAAGSGPSSSEPGAPGLDIARVELALILPLIVLMFVLGLYPHLLTHPMTALAYPLAVPWR